MTSEAQAVFNKKSFAQWLGQRSEIKSIKFQVYAVCILLLSKILWGKSFEEKTVDYLVGAILLYGLFLIFQLHRKKKRLKQEYQDALESAHRTGATGTAASSAQQGETRAASNAGTIAKYGVVLLAVGLLASIFLRKGEGLDAEIDASKGFDVNYHASLAKAFEKMSESQKSTYNWVLTDFSEGHYISRYGKHPTVREVIQGQLDLWDKNNERELADQKSLVASKGEDIAARTALQERAKALLGTVAATAEITTRAGRKSCEGVVCDDGVTTLIAYRVYDPNNLHLQKMPCSAKVTPRNSDKYYTYELDGCAKQGAFETRINVPKGESFDGATVNVLFTDNEAMADYGVPAIPVDIPEVVKLRSLEQGKKEIADARESLKG